MTSSDRTSSPDAIPRLRVRPGNLAEPRGGGDFVLYWMIASRRARWNFALEHAVAWARELGKPLVVLEALRTGYRWASDRLHRFVIDGMRDNARAFEGSGALYYPYVEPEEGAGKGLLEALAERAAVVVTDDYPCFFLPRMVEAAGEKLPVRLEVVDSNGLLPLAAADKVYARAYDFRRFLQKSLAPHLLEMPALNPLAYKELPRLPGLPREVERRWPRAAPELLRGEESLGSLPIDHDVAPVPYRGGMEAGDRRLKSFLEESLDAYGNGRNHPDEDAASGLSPFLHFGHVSTHQVLDRLADREGWSPAEIADSADGKRSGWWGMSASAEAFLDELVTWRELGYNFASRRDDYDEYESLPDWALETLAEHAGDERPHLYDLEELERAETHDELWNAAQRQLRSEGRIQNYLRMLWGKKILHWTPDPETALEIMIQLNNRWAVDGRDPNSYSGIFWVLGRFDRAWGPERPIFGKVRYMTSKSTRSKLRLNGYLERWSA
ncbi:MAG: deoxyribodipyrimidine photolyase [Thermoanaerobaculia bacterium]|nr:deoxyribodipyrimidine photolyase [Thermoanaerobaculia bacterium]